MMIITDSASDITKQEAEEMDIRIVWLKTKFSDGDFPLKTEEDFIHFFDKLAEEKELPVTSQPSPEEFLQLYEEAKEKNEEVLVITLSSGLSGTVNAANLAKQMSEYEKIWIIDSEQAIVTQRFLVQKAVDMRAQGKNMEEIVAAIEDLKKRVTVCGMLDTLTYLKKGGRIPAALAAVSYTHLDVYKRQTKAYVKSFSDALGEEVKKRGIFVTAVCPGPVRTEFFEVARTEEDGQNAKDNFMKEPDVYKRQREYTVKG